MKKLILLLACLLGLFLTSCTDTTVEGCSDGYIEYEGKCYVDDRVEEPKEKEKEEETVEPEERHKMFEIVEGQTEYINVPYKRVDGVTQYLDIYYPNEIVEDMPVFVYVHGGGFLWGNKDLIDDTIRIDHVSYKDRLNELGFIFVSVEYTKSKGEDKTCLENQISDVKDAIKWVRLNNEDLSSSDENIGLWGLSAGGALALSAALNPDDNYDSFYPDISASVKYVIDFYGVTDIYDFYNFPNYPNLTSDKLTAEYNRVDGHINMSSQEESNYVAIKDFVEQHSPLYNYNETDVIISIYHGDADKIVFFDSNAQALYDRGVLKGNEIYLTKLEGKDHGFWWDTPQFYETLLNDVVEDVLEFSSK